MSGALELIAVEDGTRLRLRVRPVARKNAVIGPHGGALKLSVTAPADRGRANEAVLELLAEELALPRGSIEILSGHSSPDKVVLVRMAPDLVAKKLGTPT